MPDIVPSVGPWIPDALPDAIEEPIRDSFNVTTDAGALAGKGIKDGTKRYLTASAVGALVAGGVALGGLWLFLKLKG